MTIFHKKVLLSDFVILFLTLSTKGMPRPKISWGIRIWASFGKKRSATALNVLIILKNLVFKKVNFEVFQLKIPNKIRYQWVSLLIMLHLGLGYHH
jgi:hypothetical protein